MKHVGVTADPKDIAMQNQLGAFTDLGDVGGSVSLDLENFRSFHIRTVSDLILSSVGVLEDGKLLRLSIHLDSDGSAVTWPASFEWASGLAPGLSSVGSYSIIGADSVDAGTTWRASRVWYRPAGEPANILPIFSSPTSGGFAISASSEYPGFPAWAPCAAEPAEWATFAVTTGYTWQVLFPAEYIVEKLKLVGRVDGEYPGEMQLHGTTDGGSTFTLIKNFTGTDQVGIASPLGGELFTMDNTPYNGIRITGVTSIGPNPGFSKAEVWGLPA